jgi:hypothetical protein
MDLLFTQKDGFVDYDPPERLRWRDGEEWDTYKARIGLTHAWHQNRGELQELRERWYSTEYVAGTLSGYVVGSATGEEPLYRVEVESMGTGSDWEIVWVKTRGDLLALRAQLVGLMLIDASALLGDLLVLTKRTFRKDHGHELETVCRECDPKEAEARHQDREEQRKREALQRVFFILNRKEGQVLIDHADDQSKVEERIRKLSGRQPSIMLALSQQGTSRTWLDLLKGFSRYRLSKNVFAASAEILEYINKHRKSQNLPPVLVEVPPN